MNSFLIVQRECAMQMNMLKLHVTQKNHIFDEGQEKITFLNRAKKHLLTFEQPQCDQHWTRDITLPGKCVPQLV